MSLTIEAIATQKGDIALSEKPWCGISQVKSQVEGKVVHRPRSRDAIRVSLIAESAGKRETTSHRVIPLVN